MIWEWVREIFNMLHNLIQVHKRDNILRRVLDFISNIELNNSSRIRHCAPSGSEVVPRSDQG